MYMTNKKVLTETQLIIDNHAARILTKLGLEDDTHILNHITVSDVVGPDVPLGVCKVQQEISGGLFSNATSYVPESANITLYPLMHFKYLSKGGELKNVPFFARFMKPIIRRIILSTLAHELRHYWQHTTGEYTKNELQFRGKSFMSYENRWCERDANEFADLYANNNK